MSTFSPLTGTSNPYTGIDVGASDITSSTPSLGDIDGDGDLDLVIGEQEGVLNYYRNTGTAIAPVYVAQAGTSNPFNSIDVGDYSAPSLADLDGDGDLDLVVGEADGVMNYHRNTGTATAPVYAEQTGTNNPFDGIDVGEFSTPSLADIDGDGDLDLVVGTYADRMSYYRNTGTATAPVYAEQTGTSNPFFSVDAANFYTPSLGDIDRDGDLDLVVGDNFGVLSYYRNTGTTTAPAYAAQTGADNPFDGVDVGNFSAPSLGDIDRDGDLDLVSGEGLGTLLSFQNQATATTPVYAVLADAANPFSLLRVGVNSNPSLSDIDGDGDPDLLVGERFGTLNYHRNTGSATAPAYAAQAGTANPFNGVGVGAFTAPSLGDIDGDGDLDLVVGASNNALRYFRNTGTATAPAYAQQTGTDNPFSGVNVGLASTPSLGDIDGDGDLDLVVGELDGVLNFFRNMGTVTNPVYAEQTGMDNPFDGLDVGDYSDPSLGDIDGDGDLDLVLGEYEGVLNYYLNTGTATAPVYAEQTGTGNPFTGFDAGFNSTPSLSDIDGDGDLDVAVGRSVDVVLTLINNDAPTLGQADFNLAATNEDTDSTPVTVASLLASAGWADGDLGAQQGLAITGTAGAGWEYSVTGSTWTPLDAASATAAVLLGAGAQLRYVPDRANGETATLSFRAWDQTSGTASTDGTARTADTTNNGGGTAFSTASSTASLVVSAVNDAPTLSQSAFNLPATDEDTTAVFTAQDLLAAAGWADVDINALQGLVITASTGAGQWQWTTDGSIWPQVLGNGSIPGEVPSFVAHGANTLFRYVPDAKNGETATLSFRAWDQTFGMAAATNPTGYGYQFLPQDRIGDTNSQSTAIGTASLLVNSVNDAPLLALVSEQTGTANPFDGIDVGDFSIPSFGDIDGDGDLDVVVGEESGVLNYYLNTGTTTAPVYALQTGANNPFADVGGGSFSAPELGDIDSDGDLDLLVGDGGGALNFYRNTGTAAAPAYVAQNGTNNPFDGIDVGLGFQLVPTFADVDGDGDVDLVVGESDGTLNYYRNTGTANAPAYALQTGSNDPFVGINVGVGLEPGYSSSPAFTDLDGDGDLDLVVGEYDGVLNYFRNTGTATAPAYAQQAGGENPFGGIDVGEQSAAAFTDLDGDGDQDLVVGSLSGTLRTYISPEIFKLAGTNEDTDSTPQSVSALLAAAGWADVDVGALQGLAITGATGAGAWQYSIGGGAFRPLDGASATNALLLGSDASVRYVPDRANGETASLSFRAWDQTTGTASTGATRSTADTTTNGGSTAFSIASSTATLLVSAVNDAPTTSPVTLLPAMPEDSGTRTITQTMLLANAADVDGPAPKAENLQISGGLGNLVDNGDGTWNYTPALNDDTSVSFSYSVSDGLLSAAGSATLDITPVNDAPVAVADSAVTRLNAPVSIAVLANDSDVDGGTLRVVATTPGSGGSAAVQSGGLTVLFTPNTGFTGFGSFSYTVSDGVGGTATANVRVLVPSITGSNGNDTLLGSQQADFVVALDGADRILTHDGDDYVDAGRGIDTITGGAGADTLLGGDGPDTFLASSSELAGDQIDGGEGTDLLVIINAPASMPANFSFTNLELISYTGALLVEHTSLLDLSSLTLASGSSNSITGGTANSRITGTASADNIVDSAGNDDLRGAGGNDTIVGGFGQDTIHGGTGNDVLYGGSATAPNDFVRDIFVFNTPLNAATNVDQIIGFQANSQDRIELSTSIFSAITGGTTPGLDTDEFRSAAGGNAADGNDYILFDPTTGNLFYDADGSGLGAKVLFATLVGLTGTLDATDFAVTGAP